MRTNKLYANADKCIFGAEEIPFLGCFIGKRGFRADPAKLKAIVDWPVPVNMKDYRKWLGLANFLHKYSENYADMARPLPNLLKKDMSRCWDTKQQAAFKAIKASLLHAPILALSDPDRPFSVICDASDFAIGSCCQNGVNCNHNMLSCKLTSMDVIAFESRRIKVVEKNYPVHDKKFLAMKVPWVHYLGSKPFVVYTDHTSLRTATQSPHHSQRMIRWLSFFVEYNFEVKYKPGKQNALADTLSRRPDYELAHVTSVTSSITELIRAAYAHDDLCYVRSGVTSFITELIRAAYAHDDACVALLRALGSVEFKDSDVQLSARLRARLHRYSLDGGLLYYSTDPEDTPRVMIPQDEELKYRILYEAHDSTVAGHLGREKTYSSVSRHYWRPKLYKWVKTYVSTSETCQRIKPSPYSSAPLASLPVPSGCWQSMSMDFVFGLPEDSDGTTGVQDGSLAAVPDTIDDKGTATLFMDRVFRQHGPPESIVLDRDPRFTSGCWQKVFKVLGTRLDMSTADHPQIDGQTVRVNRVVENMFRSTCAETLKRWSAVLSLVEFALNNAVHPSTGFTPFYPNSMRHPRVPVAPSGREYGLDGGKADWLEDISPTALRKQVDDFLSTRLSVLRHVRDVMAESQDVQKEQADARGRGNVWTFEVGDHNLPTHALSKVFKGKLRPLFIGLFTVVAKKDLAYTLSKKMRTHPVFYVGLLKPYHDPSQVSSEELATGVSNGAPGGRTV
ncbi:Pol Polyprotein [Phytophthora megakarya]|uniref:Pol Polyprotein n=1 Tax=Phytophthora megakarya TaxID=4795 RepID=A0A225WPL3_9STRA|nr:Pol Polyprotein [Phytophthora megakarya]